MNMKLGYVVIVAVVASVLFFIGGYASGAISMKKVCQAEAVKTGHAVYKVVDEFGNTIFEWLPSHGTEKVFTAPEKK